MDRRGGRRSRHRRPHGGRHQPRARRGDHGRTAEGPGLVWQLHRATQDGTRFPALVTDTGVHDDAGRLTGIVGISIDLGHALQPLLARSSTPRSC